MDLETEAYVALLKLKNFHDEQELKDWQKALSFATPEMEAFDKLLDKVEELINNIKLRTTELEQIQTIK